MPSQRIKIKADNRGRPATISVSETEAGKRLDIFLVEKFPEKSRSFWQKEIKAGKILLNGEPAKVHEFLKEEDEIKIINYQLSIINQSLISNGRKIKYKIIYKNKDYLIIEKPAGVLTHTNGKELGLADRLIKDFPEIKKVGEVGRWGIVHRLDRDASGLLVVARTKKFFEHIKKQFEEREIKKIYLALVYGEVPRDDGDLEFAIGRGETKMAARPAGAEGREATTHFDVIQRLKNYTYLQVQIFTGRTHQIRAHLLAYGHPVVGDKIYKLRRQKIKDPFFAEASNGRPARGRLFLHSHILGFKNLAGDSVEYKSRLPKELKECLDGLK